MQQHRKGAIGARSAHGRAPKVAPVARAIRIALAASATAFALAGSGAALAQTCSAPADGAVYCDGDFTVPVLYDNVDDLTLVLGENAPTSITVNSEIGARIVGNGDIGLRSDATVSVTGKYGPTGYITVGLYAASGDGAATLDNTGQVTVSGTSADGLFASGADVDIANAGLVRAGGDLSAIGIEGEGGNIAIGNAGNVYADGYLAATGILAEGAGDVGIDNSDAIQASATAYDTTTYEYGRATGIGASGDGVAIDNSGQIVTDGTYSTGIYAYASGAGGIAIANGGDIDALAPTGFASGITAVSAVEGSDIQVDNSGAIDAAGMNRANGIDVLATGLGSSAGVVNSGSVYATTPIGTPNAAYYQAEGIMVSADGDARIENTAAGTIEVVGGGQAYGAAALAFAGDASVVNAGSVSVSSYGYGPAVYGVLASAANGIASVDNSGSVEVYGGLYYANGITVSGQAGAQAVNSGAIEAGSAYGLYGVSGIQADSAAGDVSIVNAAGGDIQALAGLGAAFGTLGIAAAGDVHIDNAGSIAAYGYAQGAGAFAVAQQGDASVINSGALYAAAGAYGIAVGAFARADAGTAEIASSGTVYARSDYVAYGVLARGAQGDVANTGDVTANGYALALGLIASTTGDAAISNSGTVTAFAYGGSIGIYAVGEGDIVVDNAGDVSAVSQYSLAEGIFASGANVEVSNSGNLDATGFDWAAGIDAKAEGGATTVVSAGDIVATVTSITQDYYGRAYGIYALGSGVDVDNAGSIGAMGVYATGIHALANGYGAVGVANAGNIAAGDPTTAEYTIYATGIRAASAYAGADISVDNSGSIAANSYYGSTGIDVLATGAGSTGSVVNSGDIRVGTASRYGIAVGVAVSADGDAAVDNAGSISVVNASGSVYNYYLGTRMYGVQALSFAGDAEVVNSGDIAVDAGLYSYAGYGVVAAAANGMARVDNSGSVDVAGGYLSAVGILAQGQAGAAASNSGTVAVDSDVARYGAYGVVATSSLGDASVDNSGLITVASGEVPTAGALASGATATVSNSGQIDIAATFLGYGAVAFSQDGSAGVTNDGTITITTTSGAAVGINVQAETGATVTNTGTVALTALTDTFGVIASAASGGVSVDNSGTISVFSDTPFNGNSNGIAVAAMGDVLVDSSGAIDVAGGKYGTGISASSVAGDIQAYNSGSILVGDVKYATGIQAVAQAGDVLVDNAASGSVSASASDGFAIGVAAVSVAGDVQVGNAGTIAVADDVPSEPYPNAVDAIGLYAAAAGDVSVDNSGAISATSTYGLADGIFASGANVDVANGGSIEASGFDWAVGIEAEATGGAAIVSSSGDIVATATSVEAGYYGRAYGIYASGAGVTVDSGGMIAAMGVYATGIQAQATGPGDVSVTNGGDIAAGGYTIYAAGIRAASAYEGAHVSVDNAGSIVAGSLYGSTGIEAVAAGEGGTVSATNGGEIAVASSEYYASASGILASADAGASIASSGAITVGYGFYAYGAAALTFNGDATVDNTGIIGVYTGYAGYGALAASANGSGLVTNAGDIEVASNYPYGGVAVGAAASGQVLASVSNAGNVSAAGAEYSMGLFASSSAGDAVVSNSGSVTVVDSKYGWGLRAQSGDGDVLAGNTGTIAASGSKYATGIAVVTGSGAAAASNAGAIAVEGEGVATVYGIKAITDAGGDIAIENAAGGSVLANAYGGAAFGLGAAALAGGDVSVVNAGDVSATGSTYAGYYGTLGSTGTTAIFGRADAGGVSIDNTGSVRADNPYSSAEAVVAIAIGGDVAVNNSGGVLAVATGVGGIYAPTYSATGVYAYSTEAVGIGNAGSIEAQSIYGQAFGVNLASPGAVALDNAGSIAAGSAGDVAFGVYAASAGAITVTNFGSITASATDQAIAISVDGASAIIDNRGTIDTVAADDGRVAVWGGDGVETIRNSGRLSGAVIGEGGNDAFHNQARGTWFVDNGSTDLGDGDDVVTNAVGGTIHLQDGVLAFGSGTGNRFDNAGTIRVSGEGLIHMGTGAPAAAAASRPGMAAIAAQAAVPSLNGTPLANSGTIDFVDGAADDRLTIVGDLGGNGAVQIDVDTAAGSADQLLVDGSLVAGAAQTVNVAFNGFGAGEGGGVPLAFASVPFAQVTGNSTADSFLGGEVVGFDSGNFLDLDVLVTSRIDTSNAAADVFSVDVDVAGLNDTGAIAASVGTGAWSLMTSQIGTWRQRMGVVPSPADGAPVSAFVRTFYERGDIAQEHEAFNFGPGGNFGFEQLNSGTELGLNFEPVAGFNIGAILGKSRGKQTLHDPGIASDKLQADSYGFYGTWVGDNGWYLDASYRAMRFDARMDSAAGRQRFDGSAGAINLETGYAFALGSGLHLEPQFQYTWTTVDGVFVRGTDTYLRTDDGDWHRSRLGLAAWQAFEGGGIVWTPYGAASVVRVDDAKTGYTVGDAFRGNTGAQGTSALVELGVGLRRGALSGTFGANWSDGGALDSIVGGQLVLRYTW